MLPQKQHRLYEENSFNISKTDLSKSYRRQWNKSNNELNFEYPEQEITSEYQKRYDEYLLNLQINNQILKLANKKDENKEKLEKLELGFNTYVNGAHKTSEKFTPRHTTSSAASNDKKNSFCLRPRLHVRKNPLENLRGLELLANQQQKERTIKSAPAERSTRKQWSNASFTIKTSDGYEIKINAPDSMRKNPVTTKQNNNKLTTPTTPRAKAVSTTKKVVSSKNKKKLDKFANSNDCEYYYSDDFESDDSNDDSDISEHIEDDDQDEIEDEFVDMDSKVKNNDNNFTDSIKSNNQSEVSNHELIQSVRFSDDSDDDENIKKKQEKMPKRKDHSKKFSLKLSNNDVKLLRQSFNELNLSAIRNSQFEVKHNQLDIIDSDLEDLDLDDSKDDSSTKSNRNSTPSHSIVIDCDDFMKKPHNQNIKSESKENKSLESSTIVDLLIKKASNLTARDRNNLLKFLSNIDDDDDDDNDDKIRKDNQFLNEIKK